MKIFIYILVSTISLASLQTSYGQQACLSSLNAAGTSINTGNVRYTYQIGSTMQASYANGSVRLTNVIAQQSVIIAKQIEKEENTAEEVFVYPNPAKDELFIALVNAPVGDIEIMLLDALGRTVQRVINTEASVYMQTAHLYIADLPKGYYIIKIQALQQKNYCKTIKVVKI